MKEGGQNIAGERAWALTVHLGAVVLCIKIFFIFFSDPAIRRRALAFHYIARGLGNDIAIKLTRPTTHNLGQNDPAGNTDARTGKLCMRVIVPRRC